MKKMLLIIMAVMTIGRGVFYWTNQQAPVEHVEPVGVWVLGNGCSIGIIQSGTEIEIHGSCLIDWIHNKGKFPTRINRVRVNQIVWSEVLKPGDKLHKFPVQAKNVSFLEWRELEIYWVCPKKKNPPKDKNEMHI